MAFLFWLAFCTPLLVSSTSGTLAAVSHSLPLRGLTARTEFNSNSLRVLGPQAINKWKLDQAKPADEEVQASSEAAGASFPQYWFEQPLDHFTKSDGHRWNQRYWVSTRHYKPGTDAPVVILDSGETSGVGRLPYLDQGIVDILTKSIGGIGIVLEHRYYGKSIPVQNLTTDSLRWLNNAQALADSANFLATVKIPGIDEDVTALNRPWIYYGGSYAGARSAHMKVLYPDLVFGAIASSGVTHAAVDFWQYMEIIRNAAEPSCALNIEKTIERVDGVLLSSDKNAQARIQTLKNLFGLGELKHSDDFASALQSPFNAFQSKNWDPTITDTGFEDFCQALETPQGSIPEKAFDLPYGHPNRSIEIVNGFSVDVALLNYAKWINNTVTSSCGGGQTIEECYGTYNDTLYKGTDLSETWRTWSFQVCTQWGYFITSPPNPKQPRIVSKLVKLKYQAKFCQQAFDPGEFFVVPLTPNVTAVNALGDFAIAADRLAIIDGQIDPWRPATPHSDDAKPRKDTILRPFKLIPGGVHHWDENGLPDINDEPPEILKIHTEEIEFVGQWLKDWKKKGGTVG